MAEILYNCLNKQSMPVAEHLVFRTRFETIRQGALDQELNILCPIVIDMNTPSYKPFYSKGTGDSTMIASPALFSNPIGAIK